MQAACVSKTEIKCRESFPPSRFLVSSKKNREEVGGADWEECQRRLHLDKLFPSYGIVHLIPFVSSRALKSQLYLSRRHDTRVPVLRSCQRRDWRWRRALRTGVCDLWPREGTSLFFYQDFHEGVVKFSSSMENEECHLLWGEFCFVVRACACHPQEIIWYFFWRE